MANRVQLEFHEWTIASLIGLLFMLLSFKIFSIERQRRRLKETIFPSKYLQILSLICIAGAVIAGFLQFASWIVLRCTDYASYRRDDAVHIHGDVPIGEVVLLFCEGTSAL